MSKNGFIVESNTRFTPETPDFGREIDIQKALAEVAAKAFGELETRKIGDHVRITLRIDLGAEE